MATIKSYTDIEQSKKLAEFLPIESADMCYPKDAFEYHYAKEPVCHYSGIGLAHPCWSLVALLDVLPNGTDIVKEEADTENEKYMCTVGVKDDIICTFGNNPVDACVAMIEKLHELNLL
jgi:hypothetical protein